MKTKIDTPEERSRRHYQDLQVCIKERDEAVANCSTLTARLAEVEDAYTAKDSAMQRVLSERDSLRASVEQLTRERDEARAESARLRGALRKLMLSRDATWAGGHDWQEAIDEATAALAPEGEGARYLTNCAWDPPAAPAAPLALRPEVQAFAEAMERQLRANDHKPGWKGDRVLSLVRRLREEAGELREAATGDVDRGEVLREAADVGNFAMMIADVCGGLDLSPAPPEGEGEPDPIPVDVDFMRVAVKSITPPPADQHFTTSWRMVRLLCRPGERTTIRTAGGEIVICVRPSAGGAAPTPFDPRASAKERP